MATIVRPYNDWREQALVNFLGPIVGDWIQNARQAEQNRKQNALAAQTLQDLGVTGQGVSLTQPQMPEGYNSDGWQRAFHQGGTPLEQYDMGTASVTPQPTVYPNQADAVSAFMRNLGDKRFGMLNPQTAMQNFTPYLQANEAARIEQRKAGLVDTLKAAKDMAEKRDAMLGGYVMGDVPLEGLNAVQQQYQYDNPYLQPQTYNAGGQTYMWNLNPVNGERTGMMSIENTLTPQQIQAGQQWDKQFGETQREFDTQTALTREGREQQQGQFEAEYRLKERQQREAEEKAKFEREHPELRREYGEDGSLYYVNARTGKAVYVETPDGKRVKIDPTLQGSIGSSRYYQGLDGNYYRVNPYGIATPVVRPDGTPLTAPQKNTTASNKDLADSQKIELNRLNKREEELNKQIAAINSRMQVFADDPAMYKELQRQRDEVSSQLSRIEQQRNAILGNAQSSRPQQARPQGQTMRINIPDEIVYNPDRDANVPQNKVMTADQFRNWVNHIMQDPRAANLTPEQIIQRAIQMGIRISPEAQAHTTASGDVPAQPASPDIPPAVSPDLPANPSSGDMVVLPPSVSGDVSSGDRTITTPTASDLGYVPQEPPSDVTDANVERVMRENQPEPVSQAPRYDLTAGRRGTARRKPRAQAPVQGHVRGNPKVKTSYQQIRPIVDSAGNRHGVSTDLIRAIIQVESAWQPNARSKVGAMGLMQLMPQTAQGLGVRNAYDPAQNIEGGTKYIAQLLRRYKGNIQKAVMAYNAGPGNIDKGRIPRETQNYVRKVMNIYSKLRQRRG